MPQLAASCSNLCQQKKKAIIGSTMTALRAILRRIVKPLVGKLGIDFLIGMRDV